MLVAAGAEPGGGEMGGSSGLELVCLPPVQQEPKPLPPPSPAVLRAVHEEKTRPRGVVCGHLKT